MNWALMKLGGWQAKCFAVVMINVTASLFRSRGCWLVFKNASPPAGASELKATYLALTLIEGKRIAWHSGRELGKKFTETQSAFTYPFISTS